MTTYRSSLDAVRAAAACSFAQTFTVAKAGGTHTSFAAAFTAAAAVATTNNRVLILAYAGDFTEANPLTVPDYVCVLCFGRHETVRIICSNSGAGQHGIVLGTDTEIVGLQVRWSVASGAGAAAFHMPAGKADAELHDCQCKNADIGVLCQAVATSNFNVRELRVVGGSGTTILQADSGGQMSANDIFVSSAVTCTNFVLSDGANSVVHISGGSCEGATCTNGLHVSNTGTIHATACTLDGVTNAVRAAATAGTIIGTALSILDSGTWDILNESASSTIEIDSGRTTYTKISDPHGVVRSAGLSLFEGDEALAVLTKLIVGRYDTGKESVFGEGGSTTFGMAVLRNTNGTVGAWSDITTEMSSASGSTADLFPGVAAGNCCYFISRTTGNFSWPQIGPGIRHSLTVAMVLGAGAVIAEVWTGASWDTVYTMETQSGPPFIQYGNDVLARTGDHQIRIGIHDAVPAGTTPTPATTTLNGITGYAWRIRVTTGITTAPTAEQIKIHTNRSKHNTNGFVELFGNARQQRVVLAHQRLSDDLAGASPGNGQLAFTSTIAVTPLDNRFANGSIDGFGQVMHVNDGMDTSLPITARIGYVPRGAGGGDIELELSWRVMTPGTAGSSDGDLIDGSLSDDGALATIETVVAGDDDRLIEIDFSGFIPSAVPGRIVPWRLWRDATGGNPHDDFASNVDIAYVQVVGFFWR